jgi:hypothetical protein
MVLSAVFVTLLEGLHLPAALLLGPMIAGIAVAAMDGTVRVPNRPFYLAQAVIGCLIARGLPVSIFNEIRHDGLLFAAAVVLVIVASMILGWLLACWQVLPGTTAVWGSTPGAAAAMTLMAEAFGADVRLVAFMQYVRVVFVAVIASAVSRIWAMNAGTPPPPVEWFPPVAWLPFAETLAFVVCGVLIGRGFRIPAGPMMVCLFGGVLLQDTGLITIELPQWFLALSYALIGWTIGLRFTRAIVAHAARALPRIVASTLTLIAICGGLAAFMVMAADVDPLTAYLATSPGGADSVAIIAASSNVNLPFVMAMQAARLVVVLLTGPSLTRFMAKRLGAALQKA